MSDDKLGLSRRKILGATAAVGVAGAGAGIGTSALFSDEESFTNNSITAGELDLIVDYYTSTDQGSFGSTSQRGEINGDGATEYTYDVVDLKPGDSGTLAFCPKIVDNPGWLWVGSDDGVTDYENGQTEPEEDVDATTGGNLDNGTNDGAGAGELSDEIEVTVSYAESISYDSAADEITCNNTRELNNPDGYTLADLAKDLESGFALDGDQPTGDDEIDAYPSSSDGDDQQGPCLCIEWELPAEVGNEVQSDALELGFRFEAEQERNNTDPDNPFVDTVVSGGSIQDAIDAASEGDVIKVESGTYDEQVTLDIADVLLYSPDSSVTTITDRVVVSADGATLCGFTVSPPSPSDTFESEAIRVSNIADGVSIIDNTVENFGRETSSSNDNFWGTDGINVFGGDGSDSIEDVTVRGNTVRNVYNADQAGSAGISIQGNVDGATVNDNTVTEIGVDPASGNPVNSYAFGVIIRGTGNHNVDPKNVNVVDNNISSVLASDDTDFLGVGFSVQASGSNYLARDNNIDDINIGVELTGAATELTLTGNSISNIDNSVNDTNNPSVPPLYLGDRTGNAPIATFIADNTYDIAVTSGGPFPTGYQQTIVPQ
jgi:predicted ribosomally synthesized peptide with SipW-like signal peptide